MRVRGTGVVIRAVLFLFFNTAVLTVAGLVQHLDATVSASVTGNPVTQWADQSGSGHHAVDSVGNVYYPSTSLSESGIAGLDFGIGNNGLELFSAAASDSWLNQSSGSGFCVLIAFKTDSVIANQNDLLGNSSAVSSGFGLRYDSSGTIKAYLGGVSLAQSVTVVAGDTIVIGFNYDASTGAMELWDSKSGGTSSGSVAAGDFSLSNPVSLGRTINNLRFLDGMVGEVKIFDSALSLIDFSTERNALIQRWVGSDSSWRVIAEDANYPSDDVILAFCEVTDPDYNLSADPANTDCTAAFQAALDDAAFSGGGTVYVPAGEYRFDGDLVVPDNVTLRGRWVEPGASQPVAGTILKIYHNRNNASAASFITLNIASAVRDLAFWHPEQTPDNISPYPYVLSTTAKFGSVENVTLVNAYQGMNFSTASFLNMKNVYGSPLYQGYMVDRAYAVPRMEGAHFSPDFWTWSGLAGAPSAGGQHETFMKNNGTGILIRELDAGHVTFSEVSGYLVGLQYERSPVTLDNAGEQSIFGNVITDCTDALLVHSVKSLKIMQCTFAGNDYGVRHVDDGDLIFTDCTISGGTDAIYDELSGQEGLHEFNLQGCSIDGTVRVENKGTLNAIDCSFVQSGLDIVLNSGVSGAIISGCTFADGPDITNNSGAPAADIQISHTPVASYATPVFPVSYQTVRKPDSTTLFNVKEYGAVGDGIIDDTAAVQDALAAAQANGGGIVFFEAGTYKMTGNLDVGAGIELRGIHGARHSTLPETRGSMITINHGKGSDTGTAFITLGDRSGIRGMTFHYPDQSYLTPYKYPFMIRCQGIDNFLIDNAGTNPYQAVDLVNADNHLIEYTFFGAWKKAYQIGGGTDNGRIQSLHVKWGFWNDSELDGYPVDATERDRAEVTCGKHLDTFTINDCNNQTLFAIFNHACHTFLTQNGGTGAAFGVGVEENQRGFVFNAAPASGRFDIVMGAVNIHNQGDWTGKYSFKVNSTFDGDAVFFNTFTRGNPEYLISSEGGNLVFQQGDFNTGGSRGMYTVKAGGHVTLDNLVYAAPFDLEVPAGGSLTANHVHFDGGYSDLDVTGAVSHSLNTYAGSIITADINDDPPRSRGIVMDASNVEPIAVNTLTRTSETRSPLDYISQVKGYHLVSGSSIVFDVVDPEFVNGAAGNVDLKLQYLDDTDGTINIYYDSTSGEKLKTSIQMNSSDTTIWANKTIGLNDARFNSTQDIRIEVTGGSADPVFTYIGVESDAFLGLPASGGAGNNPPAFTSGLIVEVNGQENVAYSGTIADNASDPESDPMTFSKVSGPAWLSVASDGMLSGTPASSDAGLNSFTVQVGATGGSDTATLEITVDAAPVNQAPAFTSGLIVEVNGQENVAYSGTIADDASDPESDPMTFSNVSGPTWLAVASDGTLSGTPTSSDAGLNSFIVQVDATGGSDTATLEITVDIEPGGPVASYAQSESTILGAVSSGAIADVQSNDDVYEVLTEAESGGKPNSRHSELEHIWTFNVTGGELVTFYVEAHHDANSEGDDFVFAYSTDGVNYIDMVTVTKTSDDNTAQFYVLPGDTVGTVTIRVMDADRTPGNSATESLYVDFMAIVSESASAPPAMAGNPLPEDGATSVPLDSMLSWTPGALAASHDVYFGTSPSPAFQGNQTEDTFAPGALSASTTYYWAIDEVNSAGMTLGTVWSFTTGGATPEMYVSAIDLSTQKAGKNYNGVAIVTVLESGTDVPVQGATVSGNFIGAFSESGSAATDEFGIALITTGAKASLPFSFTFTVTDVTAADHIYNAASNVESSDSGSF